MTTDELCATCGMAHPFDPPRTLDEAISLAAAGDPGELDEAAYVLPGRAAGEQPSELPGYFCYTCGDWTREEAEYHCRSNGPHAEKVCGPCRSGAHLDCAGLGGQCPCLCLSRYDEGQPYRPGDRLLDFDALAELYEFERCRVCGVDYARGGDADSARGECPSCADKRQEAAERSQRARVMSDRRAAGRSLIAAFERWYGLSDYPDGWAEILTDLVADVLLTLGGAGLGDDVAYGEALDRAIRHYRAESMQEAEDRNDA